MVFLGPLCVTPAQASIVTCCLPVSLHFCPYRDTTGTLQGHSNWIMGHRTPVQPHLYLNNHACCSPIPNKPCSAVSGKTTTLGRTLSIPAPLGSRSVTKAGFTGTSAVAGGGPSSAFPGCPPGTRLGAAPRAGKRQVHVGGVSAFCVRATARAGASSWSWSSCTRKAHPGLKGRAARAGPGAPRHICSPAVSSV